MDLTFGEDPRMDLSVALSLLVFVGGFLFITFEMARWADGDCRSLLAVWAGENGLTVLRCHRCCSISPVFAPSEDRVLYRVTVVDREGRLRTGWASVIGRFCDTDFIARRIEVRWGRVRESTR